MDLLGQETVKPQKSKGKKIVLILLAISIVLLIISLVLIYTLKSSVSKKLSLSVNDKESQISQTLLIQDETGKRYISMKEVAGLVAYDYFEGGYLESEENGNKAYIDTIEQIIEYEADSDQICKTEQDSSLGKEYYKLKNKIIKRNNSLYIALEDFNVGCNLVYMTSQKANTIMIYTNSYLISKYQKELSGKKVDDSTNNQKALSYNMMIVSDENNKMGVMDLRKNLLIGYKYSEIIFNEYSQNFIVSNDDKYGIISKEGKTIVEPKYQYITIINYSPLLYSAKMSNKYGIIDKNGDIVINIEYDKIGYSEKTNLTQPALIIENLKNNETGLVVAKNNKYGIVSLSTGKIIIDCSLDKIYTKISSSNEKTYYVEIENTEIELNEYINYINTVIVTN